MASITARPGYRPDLAALSRANRLRNGTLMPGKRGTPAERFWAKVNKDGPVIRPELGPCWQWTAYLDTTHGYGSFGPGGRAAGMVGAHRFAWELQRGAIPDGLWVLHHCDNPGCVRADERSHLFLGDHAANMADMAAKGRSAQRGDANTAGRFQRAKTHCPQGHPYSGDNLGFVHRRSGRVDRVCRQCHRDKALARYYATRDR